MMAAKMLVQTVTAAAALEQRHLRFNAAACPTVKSLKPNLMTDLNLTMVSFLRSFCLEKRLP
jgi:hypothetical protein